MLKTITLKFGATTASQPLSFDVGPITILVGPNNGGKSLALQELTQLIDMKIGTLVNGRIVTELTPRTPTAAEVQRIFEATKPVPSGDSVTFNSGGMRPDQQNNHVSIRLPKNPEDVVGSEEHVRNLLWYLTIVLTGDGRTTSVLQNVQREDLKQQPRFVAAVLVREAATRDRIRAMVAEAFPGLYVVMDTTGQNFQFRISRRAPVDEAEEVGNHEAAIEYHRGNQAIHEFSDGTKAFVGILASCVSPKARVILIDEPEAFLHPPLARHLGKSLATLVSDRQGCLVAATHSADFLMGCIQSGKPVNIVRLTYASDVGSARLLKSADVLKMMRNPLLRSTNVMDALFHRGAVICEADADRCLYQEVNERLQDGGARGAFDALFLHAQHLQSVHQFVRPLRSMCIPAAAVVDLDVIDRGGANWENLLGAAGVPADRITGLSDTRARIAQWYQTNGRSSKDAGIQILPSGLLQAAEDLLTDLARYGVFLVPVGELEHWLPELGVSSSNSCKGPEWLIRIFEKLGEDPASPAYVHPPAQAHLANPSSGPKWSTLAVWGFVELIAKWLADAERRGMDVTYPPPERPRRSTETSAA